MTEFLKDLKKKSLMFDNFIQLLYLTHDWDTWWKISMDVNTNWENKFFSMMPPIHERSDRFNRQGERAEGFARGLEQSRCRYK